MPFYILEYEPNEDGERHIHIDSSNCYRLPKKSNSLAIGYYDDCNLAVQKAKELYNNVNGCYNCCKECYFNPKRKIV